MKEASGELSMTAIAVVAIAAIGVLFTTVIYPSIKNSLQHNQNCSAAYGCHSCDGKTCQCFYAKDNTAEGTKTPITCDDPNKTTKSAGI